LDTLAWPRAQILDVGIMSSILLLVASLPGTRQRSTISIFH
jgi:hypothetical protein